MATATDSSNSLLTKYLSDSQKQTVVEELISQLQNDKSDESTIVTICDLLNHKDFAKVKKSVFGKVEKYCYKSLIEDQQQEAAVEAEEDESAAQVSQVSQDDKIQNIILFSNIYSELQNSLIKNIIEKLSYYLQNTSVFSEDLKNRNLEAILKSLKLEDTINNSNDDNDDAAKAPSKNEVAWYLRFLEKILIKSQVSLDIKKTNILSSYFLLLSDEDISSSSLNILRWTIDELVLDRSLDNIVWDTIYKLVASPHKYHNRNGYVLWIRYLYAADKAASKLNTNGSNNKKNDPLAESETFHQLLKQRQYWEIVQQLLVSNVHEYRKYAISIVQLSVQAIHETFDNGLMKWDVSEQETYIKEWERFCVLYEITGIDTSLHQIEAGYKDIQFLLNPQQSLIPTSWGLCMVSTAIMASMDSVRKYALGLILSLDKESLVIFDENGSFFLTEVFLNFAMQASLFVAQKEDLKDDEICAYGDQLASFIENIFTSLKKANKLDSVKHVAKLLLQKLVDTRLAYDYARLYVTVGLVRGLKGKQVLLLDHLAHLDDLFQSTTENDLVENFLQKLYLRLLLNIDSKAVPLSKLVHLLGRFIQLNANKNNVANFGYGLFDEDLEFFLDFISENYSKTSLNSLLLDGDNINKFQSVEAAVIAIYLVLSSDPQNESIYKDLEIAILKHSIFPLILTELSFSKLSNLKYLFNVLQKYYLKLVTELSNNLIKHKGIWSKAYTVASGDIFGNDDENLWVDNVNLKKLWVSIAVEFQSTDVEVVLLAAEKFKLFAACYEQMKYVIEEQDEEEASEVWGLGNITELFKMSGYFFKNLNSSQIKHTLRDETYKSLFEILNSFLSVHLWTDELKQATFKLIKEKSSVIDFSAQLAVVKLLSSMLHNVDNEPLNDSELVIVVDVLSTIWELICQDRLKLNQQELHFLFIDLLFEPKILSLCTRNESVGEQVLETIAFEIIEQSFGRRGFLPRITAKLVEFQLEAPSVFAESTVFGNILIRIFSFIRLRAQAFKLVPIAARLYNKEINFGVGDIYEVTYGAKEVAARVQSMGIIASLAKNSKLAKYIFKFIIDNSKSIFHLFNPLKRIDGNEEWSRIQLYSILLVLSTKLETVFLAPYVEEYFMPALAKDASPMARTYIEWLIGIIYLNDFKLIDSLFAKVAEVDTNPSILMSYERICFLICQQLDSANESKYLKKFLSVVVPYCTSSKVLLRHFSASLMCCVKNELDRKTAKVLDIPVEEEEIVNNIYNAVTQHGKIKEYRSGDAMLWDLQKDVTLVGVCGGVLLRVSDRTDIDYIPEQDIKKYSAGGLQQLLTIPVGEDDEEVWILSRNNKQKMFQLGLEEEKNAAVAAIGKPAAAAGESDKTALQKKSGAWRNIQDIVEKDTSISTKAKSEKKDKDNEDKLANVQRSDLIVVGSLVDKPPNLGGICRLCDVLGAGLLTLGDIHYKKHPQFKNVAVTADLWLPMAEVKPNDIIAFMRKQKRENGYTLIGLEQTDKSVQLNQDLKFPKKSLIVLGKEREGIPGDILAELDFCVEIKQVGVIRSMNIQTATALIVHAYSLQYC